MSPSAQALQTLLDRAEQAMAQFDAQAMQPIIAELAQTADQIQAQSFAPAELESARSRLQRYRDLCAFFHNTLHQALLVASQNGTSGSYGPPGQDHTHATRPLIERYG